MLIRTFLATSALCVGLSTSANAHDPLMCLSTEWMENNLAKNYKEKIVAGGIATHNGRNKGKVRLWINKENDTFTILYTPRNMRCTYMMVGGTNWRDIRKRYERDGSF